MTTDPTTTPAATRASGVQKNGRIRIADEDIVTAMEREMARLGYVPRTTQFFLDHCRATGRACSMKRADAHFEAAKALVPFLPPQPGRGPSTKETKVAKAKERVDALQAKMAEQRVAKEAAKKASAAPKAAPAPKDEAPAKEVTPRPKKAAAKKAAG